MVSEVSRSRIAWFMTSQQPFAKCRKKCVFKHFIAKDNSEMNILQGNTSFYSIIYQKFGDSILYVTQMSSRLYTTVTSFLTLIGMCLHQLLFWLSGLSITPLSRGKNYAIHLMNISGA